MSQTILEKIIYLDGYLQTKGYSLFSALQIDQETKEALLTRKIDIDEKMLKKVSECFYNIAYRDLLDETKELPPYYQIECQRITEKLHFLNQYLKSTVHLSLARAVGVKEKRMNQYLAGSHIPSKKLLKRIAAYFFLEESYLTDDEKDLPKKKDLRIDPELVEIQVTDADFQWNLFKYKHYISRNYPILGHSRKMKLVFSALMFIIPLFLYTAFCSYIVLYDRFDTIEEYKKGDQMSAEQLAIEKTLSPDDPYVSVRIGGQVQSISKISPSNSSYQLGMRLWFDFDICEFHEMFKVKEHYHDIDYYHQLEANIDRKQDVITFDERSGEMKEGADQIPDYIQFVSSISMEETKKIIFDIDDSHYATVENKTKIQQYIDQLILHPLYLEEKSFYPGETSSNNFTDKQTMFVLGNGNFVADSFSYETELAYKLMNANPKKEDDVLFRYFQSCYFDAEIGKSFDNPRYPLESVQFHIYIQPKNMTTQYLRYVPTNIVNLSREVTFREERYINSVSENIYRTGVAPYFRISGGYKMISEPNIKGLVTKIHYFKDNVLQEHYRTQFEMIIRANRQGISLFLQAFVNLFAVIIWITIAFYNQSHNNEDSIGMLGTGLFGAISSILVGLSMVSDAGIFSLITMINIFTLAVILIMTYQSIAAKRANVKKDKALIAYYGVLLRITFFVLMVCTILMFVGLPLAAYIWKFA